MYYQRPDSILRGIQCLVVLFAVICLLIVGWLIFQLFAHL